MSRDKENTTQGMKFDSGEFMRPGEVARKLHVSKEHVLRLLRKGTLPGFKFGNCWLISKTALQQLLTDLVKPRHKHDPD